MKKQLLRRAFTIVATLALVLSISVPALAGADENASCVGQFKSVLQSGTGEFVQSLHAQGANIGQDVASVLARTNTDCPTP